MLLALIDLVENRRERRELRRARIGLPLIWEFGDQRVGQSEIGVLLRGDGGDETLLSRIVRDQQKWQHVAVLAGLGGEEEFERSARSGLIQTWRCGLGESGTCEKTGEQ